MEDIVRLFPPCLNQLQDVRLGFYAHATCRISGRQAEELQRKALAGREAQLGAHHPDTLRSISNLAVVLYQQGKFDEAGPRSLGWREVTFFEPGLKAWMSFCFPLFLDSNIRVMYCPMKRCDK